MAVIKKEQRRLIATKNKTKTQNHGKKKGHLNRWLILWGWDISTILSWHELRGMRIYLKKRENPLPFKQLKCESEKGWLPNFRLYYLMLTWLQTTENRLKFKMHDVWINILINLLLTVVFFSSKTIHWQTDSILSMFENSEELRNTNQPFLINLFFTELFNLHWKYHLDTNAFNFSRDKTDVDHFDREKTPKSCFI